MNAKIVLTLVSITIIIYDPLVAFISITLFYILMYIFVRTTLVKNGKILPKTATQCFKLIDEGFGSIEDVLLLDRSYDFINKFETEGNSLDQSTNVNSTLGQVLHFFIEPLAFSTVIGLVLVLIKTHQVNPGHILPILSFYVLAYFKLLPAPQQLYLSVTQIKSNIVAIEHLEACVKKPKVLISKSTPQLVLRKSGKLRRYHRYLS